MKSNFKHSKIKNTGIIFECLIRQVTADVLENKNNSYALKILKTNFKENSELGKENALYSVLMKSKFKSDKKADYLIGEVLHKHSKLNSQQLKREKYNVIKSIKEYYNISNFFSSKIENYTIHASIYKLFEYNKNLSPEDKTEVYFNILENITTTSKDINMSAMLKSSKNIPKDTDLRIITYRTLLEKFNKKYSSLDINQRNLIKAYINNISNINSLNEYIDVNLPKLKKDLKINSKFVKNKVVKIKLNEAINSIDKFCNIKSKNVKDNIVTTILRYYELLKELKSE